MVKLTFDFPPEAVEMFEQWTRDVNIHIDSFNEEYGTKYKHWTQRQVVEEAFKDLFVYGIDCTMSWSGYSEPIDKDDNGSVAVDY